MANQNVGGRTGEVSNASGMRVSPLDDGMVHENDDTYTWNGAPVTNTQYNLEPPPPRQAPRSGNLDGTT